MYSLKSSFNVPTLHSFNKLTNTTQYLPIIKPQNSICSVPKKIRSFERNHNSEFYSVANRSDFRQIDKIITIQSIFSGPPYPNPMFAPRIGSVIAHQEHIARSRTRRPLPRWNSCPHCSLAVDLSPPAVTTASRQIEQDTAAAFSSFTPPASSSSPAAPAAATPFGSVPAPIPSPPLPFTNRRVSWPDPAESEPGRGGKEVGTAARTTARLLLHRRLPGPGPWGSRAVQSLSPSLSLSSLSSRRPREI
jgi:hypothetical protein